MSAGAPVDGNSFVVRNVRVFDGDGTRERMNVVVAAGRIMTIGRTTPPSGLPVIDGTGRTLLPGLIDAHAHVPSAASLRNALRFGVTTELDMLSDINVARTLTPRRDRLDRTDLADLYSAGSPFTSPRGLGTQFGLTFSTISRPDEAAALVKGRLAEGSDYIKILYEPGAPLFTTVSRETLAAVIAAAHAAGVLAVVHISSIQGARDAVRAGVDGLVHVFSDSLIDEAFAREIAERKVFVSPTLSIFGAFQSNGFGSALAADVRIAPFLSPAQRTELTKAGPGADHPMAPYLVRFDIARALENVRMLKAAGVRLLAGTDAPNLTAHGASVHGEMELLTQAGLTPVEALAAATRAPAEAYHLAGRGRIALGARADLVLVDGNPLVDITATRAIVRVFKNGFEVTRVLSPSATPPAR
ncbi:MAG: amidohydrolase family protein [Acidobacteria bacterium]|nr:amidohydrolase family protein [Acidobacteriota bacterium]